MSFTAQETIDILNMTVKTYLAPSKIAGIGTFALRDIPKGTKLDADAIPKVYKLTHSQLKKLDKPIYEQIIGQWPQVVNGAAFAYPTVRLQAYINHSDDPNYNCFTDLTLREIKAGEEITEDYKIIKGWEVAFPWLKKVD